jgi:hypothetical protein
MNWVSSFSHVDEESGSKMDIHNLATVITPNVLYSPYKDEPKLGKVEGGVDETFLAIEAVHSLIECNESMCEVSSAADFLLVRSRSFANIPPCRYLRILLLYSTTPVSGRTMPRSLRKKFSSATATGQRLQQSATQSLSTSPNTHLAPPAPPAASTQSSQESTQTRSRKVQCAQSLRKAVSPRPTCHTTLSNRTEAQKATVAALHEMAGGK